MSGWGGTGPSGPGGPGWTDTSDGTTLPPVEDRNPWWLLLPVVVIVIAIIVTAGYVHGPDHEDEGGPDRKYFVVAQSSCAWQQATDDVDTWHSCDEPITRRDAPTLLRYNLTNVGAAWSRLSGIIATDGDRGCGGEFDDASSHNGVTAVASARHDGRPSQVVSFQATLTGLGSGMPLKWQLKVRCGIGLVYLAKRFPFELR